MKKKHDKMDQRSSDIRGKQPALAEQSCKWHTYLMLQQSRKPIFLQQVARMMLLAKLNLSLPSLNSIN
jgi:hypothetical protein